MKVDDALPVSSPTTTTGHSKKESSDSITLSRPRYKFGALAVISLLAVWSMLAGTVTLRRSAVNLNSVSHEFDIVLLEELDVIEMEDREKMVKHIWDAYTNSRRIRLPKFWQEAFEAAYEDLISEVPEVREAAISEIAKMSIQYIHTEPPFFHS